ncbi:tetratricopeptide repeat protein, partial [Candidatus Bathyarchaeota archaeon]|nr:tetratricopeptide repeat protein [Candidatus Bathyarchaeota archaeon]
MGKRLVKYNPSFLSKEELVQSFVVRHAELELIVQVLRENVSKSNQHVLVIGPRGIGKTMLVLRVVEEVQRDKDLSKFWYPLVFSEESYQVTTPGEFWLEALFHLGQQTGEVRWKQTYKELSSEQDENRLRERALSQLMDFADIQGKRILIVVENFNMLLGEQVRDNDGWILRHTLLNEPRIMLLATATSRFEEIDNAGKPMFELLRTFELKPLDEDECRTLWNSVTGEKPSDKRVRPLKILTGGNPRLLAIISTFATQKSLKELMDDLMQLVDEHTEYFKSHLDNLPPIERKVYLGLAELWRPATAREVADFARLNVNKTSSLLRRLMERGAVVLADGHKRTKLYQVAERMYNIYYLMRRRGAPSRRVKALVMFMVNFYEQEQLVSLTGRIAEEACKLEPDFRKEHFWAYEAMLESTSTQSLREKLIKVTPHDFFEMSDIPASIKRLVEPEKSKELGVSEANEELLKLLKKADDLKKEEKFEEAEDIYRKAIKMFPESAKAWTFLGELLHENLGRYDEAEEAYRKAIEIEPKYALVWAQLGLLLQEKLNRFSEAERAYRKALDLNPENPGIWTALGILFHVYLERYEEAEQMYRKAIELSPRVAPIWGALGELLHLHLKRYDEAEKAYRKVIEIDDKDASAWARIGQLFYEKPERYEEAEKAYRKAVEIDEKYAWAWARLGQLLHEKLNRYEEAEKAYRKAIEIDKTDAWAWTHLGRLLQLDLNRPDEAEKAYLKAVETDPKYPCPWAYLGDLLQERKCYEEAEKTYRKAIEKGFNCAFIWEELGSLLHEHLDRYEEAEMAYRKAIELKPEDKIVLKALIVLLSEKLGRPNEALQLLRNYFKEAKLVEKDIEDAIELAVGLAAAGYGKETLEVLRDSDSAKILEPLVVG